MDPTRDPIPCASVPPRPAPCAHEAARDDGLPPATVDQDVEEYFFE